jgi:dynein heavy chain, axonemal
LYLLYDTVIKSMN